MIDAASATADLVYFTSMAAVAGYAASAVLETEGKGMDLIGALIIGVATSLGGGTVRDVLLNRPVFWLGNVDYLMCSLLTVGVTFALARRVRIKPGLFVIPDAIGLALFSIVGCQVALEQGTHWLPASLMGVITGVFGGMLRDILVNELPLVMRPGTLYATASWLGTLCLIGCLALGLSTTTSALAGGALTLIMRLLAIRYQLSLPTYRSR